MLDQKWENDRRNERDECLNEECARACPSSLIGKGDRIDRRLSNWLGGRVDFSDPDGGEEHDGEPANPGEELNKAKRTDGQWQSEDVVPN